MHCSLLSDSVCAFEWCFYQCAVCGIWGVPLEWPFKKVARNSLWFTSLSFRHFRKITITWILFFWFMCGSCEKSLLFSDCSPVLCSLLSTVWKWEDVVQGFSFPNEIRSCVLLFISQSPCYCLLLGEWFCHTFGRACAGRYTQILLTVTLVLSKIKKLGKYSFGSLCFVNLALSTFTAHGPSGLFLGISWVLNWWNSGIVFWPVLLNSKWYVWGLYF